MYIYIYIIEIEWLGWRDIGLGMMKTTQTYFWVEFDQDL